MDQEPKYTKSQLAVAGITVVILIIYIYFYGPKLFQPRLLNYQVISQESKNNEHYIKIVVQTYDPTHPQLQKLCRYLWKNCTRDYKLLYVFVYTSDMDTNSTPYVRAKYNSQDILVYSYFGRK